MSQSNGQVPPPPAAPAAPPHVVVVGGGLAGLTAALVAADAGMKVTLLERRHRLGGATWSFERNGVSYDNGQHVFMRCFTSYRSFLERIGSADKVHLQPRLSVPVLAPGDRADDQTDDKPPNKSHAKLSTIGRTDLPAPLHLAWALLRYRHLSLRERLSAMRTALALRRLGMSLPPDEAPRPFELSDNPPTQSGPATQLDSQTFGQWLRARGETTNAIDNLWNLIVLPTANLVADEVSLLVAARIFTTGLLTDNAAADIGWSRVPLSKLHAEAASAALEWAGARVLTQAAVNAITTDPLGVELADPSVPPDPSVPSAARTKGDRTISADAIVLAVPHTEAGQLLPPNSVANQEQLADLGKSPIINVHLIYDRPVCDFEFAGTVGNEAQFVFDRTASAGLTDGRQCLGVSLSAADQYLQHKPQELIEHIAHQLEQVLPGARDVRRSQEMVTKEVAATFRATPGSNRLRPPARTAAEGVFLAGAWTDTGWPATMEGAVRSGIVAANCALEYLSGRAAEPTATEPTAAEVSGEPAAAPEPVAAAEPVAASEPIAAPEPTTATAKVGVPS